MFSFLADSGQGVVKLDVQPKCVAVGPGGYTVVVCIGQVGARRVGGGHGRPCAGRPWAELTDVFSEHGSCCAKDVLCTPPSSAVTVSSLLTGEDIGTERARCWQRAELRLEPRQPGQSLRSSVRPPMCPSATRPARGTAGPFCRHSCSHPSLSCWICVTTSPSLSLHLLIPDSSLGGLRKDMSGSLHLSTCPSLVGRLQRSDRVCSPRPQDGAGCSSSTAGFLWEAVRSLLAFSLGISGTKHP